MYSGRKRSASVSNQKVQVTKKFFKPNYAAPKGRAGNAELKFFDTATSFTTDITGEVPATGQLCLIPQGVTESTRIGRKAVIKSIQMKGSMLYNPGAASTDTVGAVGHVYVVLDKQANGAAAAVTDVLTSASMGSAFINLANSERFIILKKFIVSFNPGAGASGSASSVKRPYSWYSKYNIPLEFSSTTGAITEIRSNNVFLLAGIDGAQDDSITVTGAVRIRYSDQ